MPAEQLELQIRIAIMFALKPYHIIIIIIINLPKRKAYTKGKACTRCPPTKNKHTYTYSTLQTKQYTTKHKTVIKKLLDT